jgi:competence protein ComEC
LFLTAIVAGSYAWSTQSSSATALHFLDVGQGDSSLIVLSTGERILIDGGPTGTALLKNLSRIIPANDRYIDLVILTHPQLDHFGGLIDLLDTYKVGAFIGTGRRAPGGAYAALREAVVDSRVPYLFLHEGAQIVIGSSSVAVIGPSLKDLVSKELNDSCIVVLLRAPDVTALYTGDIGLRTENQLRLRYNLDVDVLKVGHHGSRFSSGDAFLAAVSPRVAVIGVGKNSYGHPTAQALTRLHNAGARILRTDKVGAVQLRAGAGVLEILHAR